MDGFSNRSFRSLYQMLGVVTFFTCPIRMGETKIIVVVHASLIFPAFCYRFGGDCF